MNGVKFGNKHSYSDWGLILKSRPEISSPKAKTLYLDIPATDGSLDLTEVLTGDVKYENRDLKCEFTVIEERSGWSDRYSEILNYLQGQRLKIIFDEDPKYYYFGRLHVDEWKSNKRTSTIVISGNVEPYKLEIYSTTEDWLWDTFNFEKDMIKNYVGIEINDNNRNIEFYGSRKKVVPTWTITTTDGLGFRVYTNSLAYKDFPDGTYKIPDVYIKDGKNVFVFKAPSGGSGLEQSLVIIVGEVCDVYDLCRW